ncbi:hypothetical protein DFH11DRAFT_1548084 [Phellopilus nigrolimitatus]|nr:hypothetical protein DFH11DRAFT_1548084 [Phellopilus nigrolimitatus]
MSAAAAVYIYIHSAIWDRTATPRHYETLFISRESPVSSFRKNADASGVLPRNPSISSKMEVDEESVSGSAPTIISSRDGTPAPSIYSYSSSRDGRNMLREVGGRTLNAQNDLYLLPAGRLYIAIEEVETALAPSPGVERAILDLGCGGGIWATSMAQEFPHAQLVSLTKAAATELPFTLGLEHYYGMFDVVHARAVANGFIFGTGGVLIVIEGNFEIMNEEKEPQEIAFGDGAPGQSWLARICYEAYNVMAARGSSVGSGVMLERWMNECPSLQNVKYDVKWIPVGPWETDHYVRFGGSDPEDTRVKIMLGTLMRQNLQASAWISDVFLRLVNDIRTRRSLRGLLYPYFWKMASHPRLSTDLWTDHEKTSRGLTSLYQELDVLDLHMYLRYHHCWARRVGPTIISQSVHEMQDHDEPTSMTSSEPGNMSSELHDSDSAMLSFSPPPQVPHGRRALPVI